MTEAGRHVVWSSCAPTSARRGISGFDDIEQLGAGCRFADCSHGEEPACAVRRAVEQGELLEERLASYRAIARDAERLRGKHDALARLAEKAEGKRFGRMVREAKTLERMR